MWLEGPLQSWGNDSKHGRRETLTFPTKSGVAGLICASMGKKGEQTELLRQFSKSHMTVMSFVDNSQLSKGFLRDFQTVGNGYDSKDPFSNLFIPKTSDGKAAVGGGSKITYRYYLQSATFAVILELAPDLCEQIAIALQSPRYFTSLGRRNCCPSEWIYQGIFYDFDAAQTKALDLAAFKSKQLFQKVLEGNHPELNGDIFVLKDVPIQFGTHKQYSERYVTVISYDENKSVAG